MTWSLGIHHIGLHNEGDATLLIAKDTPAPTVLNPAPMPTTIRAMLIDGGLGVSAAATINNYCTQLNLASVDIIVATHYDKDHFSGLIQLLKNTNYDPRYDNVLIFDQGEQGTINQFNQGPYDMNFNRRPTNRETMYADYLTRIHRLATRYRITAGVSSDPTNNQNWLPPNWLIGKEILWSEANRFDQNGNYDPNGTFDNMGQPINNNLSSWAANGNPLDINGNSLIPAGAPTVHCLAANQYVTGQINPVGGQGVDPRNEKSIIFLVTFGNFKYYIGGDAESAQEDALINVLNPTNNDAGRVHAIKLSHHGAATATSQNFINRLRPKAAFISNGPNNKFGHPHQGPINNLEGRSVLVMNNGVQTYPHGLQKYYLTGSSTLGATANRPAPATLDANLRRIPTWPINPIGGGRHLVINVSNVQANNNADGHGVNNFTVEWKDAVLVPNLANLLAFQLTSATQQANH